MKEGVCFNLTFISAGCKPYSFHKYVEQAPYTKDHFAVRLCYHSARRNIDWGVKIKKEEENANWTCLIAATGKDGEVLDDRSDGKSGVLLVVT